MEKDRNAINLDKHSNKIFRNHSESGSWTKVFIDAVPLGACRETEFYLTTHLANTLQMAFFTSVFYLSLTTVYSNAY